MKCFSSNRPEFVIFCNEYTPGVSRRFVRNMVLTYGNTHGWDTVDLSDKEMIDFVKGMTGFEKGIVSFDRKETFEKACGVWEQYNGSRISDLSQEEMDCLYKLFDRGASGAKGIALYVDENGEGRVRLSEPVFSARVYAAPFQSLNITSETDLQEAKETAEETFRKNVEQFAKLTGVKVEIQEFTNSLSEPSLFEVDSSTMSENIGGYKGTAELSYTIEVTSDSAEDTELFSSLIADLAFENQDAVIATYVVDINHENADQWRYSLDLTDNVKTEYLIKALKESGIDDYTYNRSMKRLEIINFDYEDEAKSREFLDKLDKFIDKYINNDKENIHYGKGFECSPVKSSYLSRTKRDSIYKAWTANRRKTKENANLYNLVERAQRTCERYLKKEKRKQFDERVRIGKENVHNKDNLSPGERLALVNGIAASVSEVVDKLINDEEYRNTALSRFYKGVDLSNKPRKWIIDTVGIWQILYQVQRDKFKTTNYDRADFPMVKEDKIDKLNFAAKEENFEALATLASSRIMALEGVSVTGSKWEGTEISPAAYRRLERDMESGDLEEGWMRDSDTVSTKSSLSQQVRYALSHIIETDENGNMLYDDDFGIFPKMTSTDLAVASILNWTYQFGTIEEVEEKLNALAESYPWLQQVVDLIKEEPLRTKFFVNFRKNAQPYSVIRNYTVTDDDGMSHLVTQIKTLNAVNSSDSIRDSIVAQYDTRTSPLYKDGKPDMDKINKTVLELNKVWEEAVMTMDRGRFNKEFVTRTDKDSISFKLAKLLNTIGFNVDASAVSCVLNDTDENLSNINSGSKSNIKTIHNCISNILNNIQRYGSEKDYSVTDTNNQHNVSNKNTALRLINSVSYMLAENMPVSVERSAYINGNQYFSFTNPNHFTELMRSLGVKDEEKLSTYIENEFGEFRWFKSDDEWLNDILESLINDGPDFKRNFTFKNQKLSYNVPTDKQVNLQYAISLITEFFADVKNSDRNMQQGYQSRYANYCLPVLSDYGTSMFFHGKRYSRDQIKEKLCSKTFKQEVLRIKSVIERAQDPTTPRNKYFDLNDKDHKELISKLRSDKYEGITAADLVKDGKMITDETGLSFRFMDFLNDYIVQVAENGYDMDDADADGFSPSSLVEQIINLINAQEDNDVEVNHAELSRQLDMAVDRWMDSYAKKETDYLESIGLFEERERGSDGIFQGYKNLDPIFGDTKAMFLDYVVQEFRANRQIWNDYVAAHGINPNARVSPAQLSFAYEQQAKARLLKDIKDFLGDFIQNDFFAKTQMTQLLQTDIAFFGPATNYFKRAAMNIANGLMPNISARDFDGNLYSADGQYRSVIVSDGTVKSDVIPNISSIFDSLIDEAKNDYDKETLRKIKNESISALENIDSTDGQSLSSPTGHRKKMGMLGEWTQQDEEAYKKICSGDFSVADINAQWETIKSVVTGTESRDSHSKSMGKLRVPIYYKHSESLLMFADALMRGKGRRSKLSAIYDFMERSAYDGRSETTYDEKTGKYTVKEKGTYNGKGIDAVMFTSVAKSGLSGVVDINDCTGYEDTLTRLENAAYTEGTREQNMDTVHSTTFENYRKQINVHDHFTDDRLGMPSQERMSAMSGVDNDGTYEVAGKQMKGDAVRAEYDDLVVKNINASIEQLADELDLDSEDPVERRRALEKLLQNTMKENGTYSQDMMYALSLDENGDWHTPPSDPTLSYQVEMLLESIIKKRVNKQQFIGGTLVQATSYGLSEKLNIRFKDKDGNLVMSYKEFCESRGEQPSDRMALQYSRYTKENNYSLAYFECLMPVPSETVRELITNEDGSYMSVDEALEKGYVTEEMLKGICTRVPVEGYSSISAIRCVGFTAANEGAKIVLPEEITALTGCDFDVDKMYVMLKEFSKGYNPLNVRQLEKDFKDVYRNEILSNGESFDEGTYQAELQKAVKRWPHRDYKRNRNSRNSFEKSLYEFIENNSDKYVNENAFTENANLSTTPGRNNRIFDLMWGVLTDRKTTDRIFRPQGFSQIKSSARVVDILKADQGKEYYYSRRDIPGDKRTNLYGKSWKELDKILSTKLKMNPMHLSTNIYFLRQENLGQQMIGIAANNKTSHQMVSRQNITVKPKEGQFTINGITVSRYRNNKLDPVRNFENDYTERALAEFVGAAADTAKDPTFNSINYNTFTCNPAALLLRLGFDINTVSLLMSQPVVQKVSEKYFVRSAEGYVSADEVINEELSHRSNVQSLSETISSVNFTTEKLAQGLYASGQEADDFQTQVLLLFRNLMSTGSDLNTMTLRSKYNSMSSAGGPTIATDLANEMQYNDFVNKTREGKRSLSKSAADVVTNDPISNAFCNDIVGDDALMRRIFKNTLPQYSTGFDYLMNKVGSEIKGKLDAELIQQLSDDLKYYMFTFSCYAADDDFNENLAGEKLVNEFQSMKKRYPDNAFLNAVQVVAPTQWCPYPTLSLDSSKRKTDMTDISTDWEKLISGKQDDSSEVKFTRDLLRYELMRHGFSYSPKSFFGLATVNIKNCLQSENFVQTGKLSYNEMLDEINTELEKSDNNYLENYDNFIIQFIRNNSDNTKLAPKLYLTGSQIQPEITTREDGSKLLDLTPYLNTPEENLLSPIISDIIQGDSYYTMALMYNNELYIRSGDSTEPIYVSTTKLGVKDNFKEYDFNLDGLEMESVFDINDNLGPIEDEESYSVASNNDDAETVAESTPVDPIDPLNPTASTVDDRIEAGRFLDQQERQELNDALGMPQSSYTIDDILANEAFSNEEAKEISKEANDKKDEIC